jgi:transposase
LKTDADYNAAVNILHRGIYNSSVSKTNLQTSNKV